MAVAFIPDYYMTEYEYPGSARMRDLVANLEANRGPGLWESVVRAMLLATYQFGAVDIQDRPLDPAATPVLVLGAARYMDGALQQKLIDYLQAGGHVLLYGEVPLLDMDGALRARCWPMRSASSRAARAEVGAVLLPVGLLDRLGRAMPNPRPVGACLRRHPRRGDPARRRHGRGLWLRNIPVGAGRVIAVTAGYNCDVAVFRGILERLGAVPGCSTTTSTTGSS